MTIQAGDTSDQLADLEVLQQQHLEMSLRLERYEQQLKRTQLINLIAEASNDTSAPEEAVQRALEQICESAGWPLAHAFFVGEHRKETLLFSTSLWHVEDRNQFAEFMKYTESLKLLPGEGLPGIVYRDRDALWANAIRSDAKRFAMGRKVGLQSAFAFPIMIREQVVAVLEFFSYQNLAPDEILLDIVSQLGMLLGRVFERHKSAKEHDKLNVKLIMTSRRAGMAEIASGVLHNVGNVLNSITVSSNILQEKLRQSSLTRIEKLAELLKDHSDDLADFLTSDKKGSKIIEYMEQISKQLKQEQNVFANELESLLENIEHIKNVVRRQQDYATSGSVLEKVKLNLLLEDALKINNLHNSVQRIKVIRVYDELPNMKLDKHNVMQILINLIGNAKQALREKELNPFIELTTKIHKDEQIVDIEVADNGCGISEENKDKIFSFGFTTREDGHGFGLHTCANTAKAMGGKLTFESEGDGRGTKFKLSLPFQKDESVTGEIAA